MNQVLTTIKLYTELCADGKVDLNVFLPKCAMLLNETINEIRSISKQLHAPVFHTKSIAEALKDLVASVKDTQKVAIELEISEFHCATVDEDLQLTIYRIAQEHLNNIIKHARARQVLIKFQCTDCFLSLIIKDDGVGFDPMQKRDGLGITNMTNRSNLFGGQLYIKSSKGNGCTLTLSFSVVCTNGTCAPTKN